MNVGFDLDKIFINFPPLIPSHIIRKLYGEKVNSHLSYRFPGKVEQRIRQLSHLPILRQPIVKNIHILREMSKNTKWNFFLISSRYDFLKEQTEQLMNRYQLRPLFKKLYFNYTNVQPHLFKSQALTKERIQVYIDDDLPLLLYLAKKHPTIRFFWLNKTQTGFIKPTVEAITQFSDFFKKL